MITEKFITYSIPTTVTVIPDATVTNLAQITINIPETVIAFKAVGVEIAFQDIITATGGTIAEHRVGFRVGAAAYTTFTEVDDITQTGENIGGVIAPVDFTAHMNTNWVGPSMTLDLQVFFDQNSGTTLGMINVNALVTISYTYDDDPVVNATQIKTVPIPLESLIGALGTVANGNIGSNQIPQLTGAGGMLPETGITIRDYFFVIEANTGNNAAGTDFQVQCNIDSGTAFAFGITEAALATDYFTRLIFKPDIPATGAVHNFQMWSSLANRMNHASITLFVTYEFTPATSDTILVTNFVPLELGSPLGITTGAEASRFFRELSVQDPGPIVLQQSAFRFNFNTTGAIAGLRFRAAGQAYRLYTNNGSIVAGMFTLQQRIDSGGAQGAGITLSRGFNEIVVDGYATDTLDQATNLNGYIILNYHAAKSASGLVGDHPHMMQRILSPWNALLQDRVRTNSFALDIPETDYWISAAGFSYLVWASTAANALTFDVEVLSGEGKGAGYLDIYADAVQTDAERGCSIVFMRGRDVFKRYPTDRDSDRLDIETARAYRLYNAATAGSGMYAFLTLHRFKFLATGTVTGFTGTVTITLHRAANDAAIGEVTRAGDGTYSIPWYDNTSPVYVTVTDGIKSGRSAEFYAA